MYSNLRRVFVKVNDRQVLFVVFSSEVLKMNVDLWVDADYFHEKRNHSFKSSR